MKKTFIIALCALVAGFSSCTKDGEFDEILATIEDNQVSIAGKTVNVDGYAKSDGEFAIFDIFSSTVDDVSAGGYIQGDLLGKEIDLTKVDCKEFILSMSVSTRSSSASAAGPGKEYVVHLEKLDGELVSRLGDNAWDKDPVKGSCFKSGKVKVTLKDGKATLNAAGTLNDGTDFAVKLSMTYEKDN